MSVSLHAPTSAAAASADSLQPGKLCFCGFPKPLRALGGGPNKPGQLSSAVALIDFLCAGLAA